MTELLNTAKASGLFTSIDYHFAKSVSPNKPQHQLIALLVSHAYGMKHTMIPYEYLYDSSLWFPNAPHQETLNHIQAFKHHAKIQSNHDWEKPLAELKVIHPSPLSLTDFGIYLTKNLVFEHSIVNFLKNHQNSPNDALPQHSTQELLHLLFPIESTLNHQKIAAANALLSPVSIISGGPGTGKTTTVIKILLLLLNEHPNLHISLAAPTGKAAARLNESIEKQKHDFTLKHPELCDLLNKIPNHSTTLHRLLGINPERLHPKFHAYHTIPTDIIIIDEASMIDLYIFNLLIEALPKQNIKVIILGDKDQLSSVEAGAIMAEVCQNIGYNLQRAALLENILQQSLPTSEINDHTPLNTITLLTHSHRFSKESGIGQLAHAVNEQQSITEFKRVVQKFPNELTFLDSSNPETHWHTKIDELLEDYLHLCRAQAPIEELFHALHTFRILCATNVSDFGTQAINQYISEKLFDVKNNQAFYHGQAIMILQNDYHNDVFNGDIGIISQVDGRSLAYFENGAELKKIPVQLLPHCETAFAMTIHKSQGSEFDNVMIILPNFYSPILTKELLYTGITRAKHSLTLLSTEQQIKRVILSKTQRFSGISHQLNQ